MSGKKQHYYWDTCIFLAYLKQENSHNAGELEEINNQLQLFEMGQIDLYTSAITITELMAATRLNESERDKFREVTLRSNFGLINADENVCFLASNIREHFVQNPIKDNNVDLYPSTPDSIHIASAIAIKKLKNIEVDLITLDSRNKKSRDGKHMELGITKCSQYIESAYAVKICRPEVPPIIKASHDKT